MEPDAGQAYVDGLEQKAKAELPRYMYGYFAGTAGSREAVQDAAPQSDAIRQVCPLSVDADITASTTTADGRMHSRRG